MSGNWIRSAIVVASFCALLAGHVAPLYAGTTPTITFTHGPTVYDGNTHVAAAVALDGTTEVPGTFTFTYDGVSTAPRNAATYAVHVDFVPTDIVTYDNTAADGSLTVDKAPLTLTAVTDTKEYDATTASAATPTIAGLRGSDTVTGVAQGYSDVHAATGKTLTVTAHTVNDGNGGSNYLVTLVPNTTGVVSARPLTVTAVANTKAHDATTSAAATPSITSGALQGTDTAGFLETYDTPHVGTGKTLTPSGIVNDGNNGSNYTYTFVANPWGAITDPWTLLPTSQWTDQFSPLWTNGAGGWCEGDPYDVTPDTATTATRTYTDPDTQEEVEVEYVVNEVMINFDPYTTAGQITLLFDDLDLDVRLASFEPDPLDEDSLSWFDVKVLPESSYYGNTTGLITYLRGLSTVQSADYNDLCNEHDHGEFPHIAPDDWDDNAELVNLNALGGWQKETGIRDAIADQVGVVIIDSGIDVDHEDLVGKIYRHPINGTRQGLVSLSTKRHPLGDVDDATMPELKQLQTNSYLHEHGTLVAGVVGAETDNNKGVASCGPGITVMSARARRKNGKPVYSSIVGCIILLKKHYSVAKGFTNLRVANMSLDMTKSDTLGPAIKKDKAAGDRLYVASAGNERKQKKVYPAAYPFVLGVTGVSRNANNDGDVRANFPDDNDGTNFWFTAGMSEDAFLNVYGISAYFRWLKSTDPTDSGSSGKYGFLGGTSASAPQIAALAALLFIQNTNRTPGQVMAHIKRCTKGDDHTKITFTVSGTTRKIAACVDFEKALGTAVDGD